MKPTERDTKAKQFKPVRTRIKSLDEKERTIEFVASSEAIDRYGDVIRVAGWDTRNYEQNPVFLWAHESDKPPIGKCVGIEKDAEAGELVQKIQFADRDTYPFADTVFKLYKGGYLNAVSVGFMASAVKARYEETEDGPEFAGYEFLEQELMELSAVPVPANPEALGRAVQKGVISSWERKEFVSALSRFEAEARALCGDSSPWLYLAPGATYAETDTDPAEQEAGTEKSKPNPYGGISGINEGALEQEQEVAKAGQGDCPKAEGCPKQDGEDCPAEDCPMKSRGRQARPSEQLKALCDEGRNLARDFRRELDGIKAALWNIQSAIDAIKRVRVKDGAADGAVFVVGDRVRILAPHVEGHETATVKLVEPGNPYGVAVDGMEDMGIHKWYAASEIELLDETQEEGAAGKQKKFSEDGGASTKTAPEDSSAPAKTTEESKVIATVEQLFDVLVKK